jgi:hypothetical protein
VDSDVQTATPPPFSTLTFTPAAPETGALTATPPPYPTFTFTPTISPSPIPQSVGTSPIKFDPNGTYVDVVDAILVGTSKSYSLNAIKGQIMSVSVHVSAADNWTVVPIKIVGADGTTLCPQKQNQDCNFWRGILPVSQDYFVTLTPDVYVKNFTLRVAINPIGVTSQSFQYVSQNQHVSFTYTDEFAPIHSPVFTITKSQPEFVLSYIDTQAYTDTNLVEAYVLFNSTSDRTIVQTCTQPVSLGGPEQVIGDVNINGVEFVHSAGGGVATGSFYEQSIYRTVQHATCYEVIFLIHSFDPGVLAPPNVVTEFDRAALLQRFEAILSTLSIK